MDWETILLIVMVAFLFVLFVVAVASDAFAVATVSLALRGSDPSRWRTSGQYAVPTDEFGGE